MITPEYINKYDCIGTRPDPHNIDEIIKSIDESMLNLHGLYGCEQAILYGLYPEKIIEEIANRYVDAGWNFVYYEFTDDNDCGAGLTILKFSMDEIIGFYPKECYRYVNHLARRTGCAGLTVAEKEVYDLMKINIVNAAIMAGEKNTDDNRRKLINCTETLLEFEKEHGIKNEYDDAQIV